MRLSRKEHRRPRRLSSALSQKFIFLAWISPPAQRDPRETRVKPGSNLNLPRSKTGIRWTSASKRKFCLACAWLSSPNQKKTAFTNQLQAKRFPADRKGQECRAQKGPGLSEGQPSTQPDIFHFPRLGCPTEGRQRTGQTGEANWYQGFPLVGPTLASTSPSTPISMVFSAVVASHDVTSWFCAWVFRATACNDHQRKKDKQLVAKNSCRTSGKFWSTAGLQTPTAHLRAFQDTPAENDCPQHNANLHQTAQQGHGLQSKLKEQSQGWQES